MLMLLTANRIASSPSSPKGIETTYVELTPEMADRLANELARFAKAVRAMNEVIGPSAQAYVTIESSESYGAVTFRVGG